MCKEGRRTEAVKQDREPKSVWKLRRARGPCNILTIDLSLGRGSLDAKNKTDLVVSKPVSLIGNDIAISLVFKQLSNWDRDGWRRERMDWRRIIIAHSGNFRSR
jgi:hypothetical protein